MASISPEEYAMKRNFLKQRQSLPLHLKIELSKNRIKQFYEHFDGQVYVSFSGGKDSTVLLHLVRSLYPEVPAVFVDTGLEYPEVRQFVKQTENTITIRPKITFKQVLEKYGEPYNEVVYMNHRWDHDGLEAQYNINYAYIDERYPEVFFCLSFNMDQNDNVLSVYYEAILMKWYEQN